MGIARVVCLLAVAGVVAGCKSPEPAAPKRADPATPAAKTGVAATPAFDFEGHLRREAAPLAVTKIKSGVLSAEVEAASAPQVTEDESSLHVVIPIGTLSNIDCYVYNEQHDGAGTISHIIDAVGKKLDVRLFAATDVFVAGEHAALVAHAIYLADQNGVQGAGELKLVYYNSPLTPTLCMQDEGGYSETFKRVTKRFFETARRSDRELRGQPRISWDVSVFKIDGRPIGFDERSVYEDPATRRSTSISIDAALYPRSASACRPEDSVTTTIVDASGDLLEYARAVGSGQELELNIDVKRLSPAQYTYSGQQSGKPIAGKFKTKDKAGIATNKRITANVKERLLSGKSTFFNVEEYSPSVDPTAPLETLYEIDSKAERRIRVAFGPLKLTTVVDENGEVEKMKATLGNATLTGERLAAGGKR